ncbi:MAG: DUF4139 domain-containing protein [Bacteroidales bacterium]|nr:DUF4139 domain-containing protein [Bacteroidales bacterium]
MNRLLVFLMSLSLLSIGQETEIDTKIEKVNVFLNGAQLTRKAQFQVKEGVNNYVLTKLSADVDPNSIQVKGKGKYTILSVKHRLNYLTQPEINSDIKMLRDSLRYYAHDNENQQQTINALTEERSMILQNKNIKSEQQSLNVLELQKLADFYRSRLQEVNLKLLNLNRKTQENQARINALTQQERAFFANTRKNTSEIVLTLMSELPQSGSLEVSYKISQAGWIPAYDIRAGENDAELKYKATVYQTTGEDWEDVKLTLSTGQLNVNNNLPNLNPWYLQYYEQYRQRQAKLASKSYAEAPAMELNEVAIMDYDGEEYKEEEASSLSSYNTTSNSIFNTEFEIGLPMDIKSNAEGQVIAVNDYTLPVNYRYFAIPKINQKVYLIARITGWENLYLLPGEMSLYNKETYVGKTYIDPSNTQDTLELSMGQDPFISIQRKMIKDFTNNQVLGLNRKQQRGVEISLKNQKSTEVELLILDQIPITSSSEIEIKLENTGGAEYDEDKGLLKWQLKLPAKGTQSFQFIYSVKYPKNKTIQALN